MVNYAKCATIREIQLNEKKDIWQEKKQEEKRKDLMMEIERLKKIKFYEEHDAEKKAQQYDGHCKIIEQIKERELIRLREKEDQEREGHHMIKAIQSLEVEERQKALVKRGGFFFGNFVYGFYL